MNTKGNTPTGVGKTVRTDIAAERARKHPHGRGEDLRKAGQGRGYVETPPRAWGRQINRSAVRKLERNTPTGVGKTPATRARQSPSEKHPHGRGEDRLLHASLIFLAETPPRAWGRHPEKQDVVVRLRNTPTGVGKTRGGKSRYGRAWKHPHGRGEDRSRTGDAIAGGETPPRAWGRLRLLLQTLTQPGNTPTGVGKTHRGSPLENLLGKHPHGRGEDVSETCKGMSKVETPPRAWGRRRRRGNPLCTKRNTPTGVGKTRMSSWSTACIEKHPHGRGEDSNEITTKLSVIETPPRAWGRLFIHTVKMEKERNTPTGVGKTPPDPRSW